MTGYAAESWTWMNAMMLMRERTVAAGLAHSTTADDDEDFRKLAAAGEQLRRHGWTADYADDDEFADAERHRRHTVDGRSFWTAAADHRPLRSVANHNNNNGPLDLSIKTATSPTTTTVKATVTAHIVSGGVDDAMTKTTNNKTPAKRSQSGDASKRKRTNKTAVAPASKLLRAATRKLHFVGPTGGKLDQSSPVSGTIIVVKSEWDADDSRGQQHATVNGTSSPRCSPTRSSTDCGVDDVAGYGDGDTDDGGDIDPEFNVVVATDEARRRLDQIPNVLGPYQCRLCEHTYTDAFALARHRCRCIVHVRYRCPECSKVFQCPANLASHRRWHGNGTTAGPATVAKSSNGKTKQQQHAQPEQKDVQDHQANVASPPPPPPPPPSSQLNINVPGSPTVTITTAGFKKNMLHRVVQAAAAAANSDA